jgi:hypothetical protein
MWSAALFRRFCFYFARHALKNENKSGGKAPHSKSTCARSPIFPSSRRHFPLSPQEKTLCCPDLR